MQHVHASARGSRASLCRIKVKATVQPVSLVSQARHNMPTIYALGGVSVSGKTWLRTHHPTLKPLRCIDIERYYREAEAQGTTITWDVALEQFVEAVEDALQEDDGSDIVLEAFFRPGSLQRERIEDLADELGADLLFIWCAAPREECRDRVEFCTADTEQRREARLRFIDEADESYFEPIEDETPEQILGSRLGQCRMCERITEMSPRPQCCGPNDVCADCVAFPPFEEIGGLPQEYMEEKNEHGYEVRCENCEEVSEDGFDSTQY